MKILMVNKFLYPRGGSESYMLKLSQELKSQGHEVQYFGMYDEKNTVGNSSGLYTTNMDFHSKGAQRFLYPFKIIYSREAHKKISKVLDDFKPDIVHMNNINFQLTPSIIYAVKKRNIPLVQTVHDYQMICPNHLLYSFNETKPCDRCIKGSKWNCLKYNCIHDSKVKSLLGVIEAKFYSFLKTYKKVDLYICPSRFLENKLLSASDIYSGKTFTIHNFIEKNNISTKTDSENPYIVFVGRLSKEKGVELLANTAKLLPDINFVACGSGPDDEVLNNIPNITLKGFVTGKELTDLMANAKLLIAPSVCYENNPLSILEAHSMGVPVVTMNHGGMAELVEDEKTGVLASSPTPESVAEAVKKCLGNEEYYKTLKTNCETKVKNIMDVTEYCDILIHQYNNLIDKR
ncbi:MAG: glycosyltransferase [Clostridia bacterium]|nr:glycosyltransferase [Clostridia bacterium]